MLPARCCSRRCCCRSRSCWCCSSRRCRTPGPCSPTEALDFLTSDTSRLDTRAGVWQGLVGSLILIGFVAVVALPLGDRGGRLPAGVRARHAAEPAADHEHPEPRRACRRSSTASSASSCSCRRCGAITGPDVLRAQLHRGRAHARGARDADRHPDHDGGAAGGAERASARPPTASAPPGGRSCGATCCPYAAPGRPHRRDPVARPRVRRDRAAPARGRRDRATSRPRRDGRRSRSCRVSTRRCRRRSSRGRSCPAKDWQAAHGRGYRRVARRHPRRERRSRSS